MKHTDRVVTTISFDLYGCVQAVVTPPVGSGGEVNDGQWFDVTRLDVARSPPRYDPAML